MSHRFSVIFCGTSSFAVPSLDALANDDRFAIQLVITQPDRPVGRKQILTPPPVKIAAQAHDLPILQPENINRDWFPDDNIPVDFFIAASYGQLLSQRILDLPRLLPVNVHASLLPRWRGASPIQNAILAGDTVTGITVQRMVKELDAGPILRQAQIAIDPRDTYGTLEHRLAILGGSLLVQTLSEPLTPQEQNPSAVTTCRKLSRADGMMDTRTQTAEEIDRAVRALTPWPGVTVQIDDQPLKLLETALTMSPDAHPLTCGDGSLLYLVRVQPHNGKAMTGAAWARGYT